ncbi:predicted protein [Botrytis cinerea T4]|uniref:Uncharacterized protein n=1 Tax=Botryotinia fuckeliana (strain T4) TaxID=999810 RepID=G2YNF2_BOTF4|nr:predicted protein [Botrytis cinerea T4]
MCFAEKVEGGLYDLSEVPAGVVSNSAGELLSHCTCAWYISDYFVRNASTSHPLEESFVTSSNTHPPIDKASRVQLKTDEKDNLYTSESTPMVYHQLGRRRIQQAEQRCQDLTQSNSPLFTERCLQILR